MLKEAPEGARILDLAASHAARAEVAASEPKPFIKLSAGFVELRPEFDLFTADDLIAGRYRDALSKMCADPSDVEELVKGGLTAADLQDIADLIAGKSLGE